MTWQAFHLREYEYLVTEQGSVDEQSERQMPE